MSAAPPRPLRVDFAIHAYFPYSGLARDLRKIATECVRRGHRARVYAMNWRGPRPAGVEVVLLAASGLRGHVRQRRFAAAVLRARRRDSGALLVGMNKMPGLDAYYAGETCFVARARARRPRAYQWTPRYRHFAAFERAVFAPPSRTLVLAISTPQTALYQSVYGTPLERLRALPPNLERTPDKAAQPRPAVRASLGVGERELLLLLVGSGFATKGLDRAVRGLAALPPALRARVRLHVAGTGRPRPFQRLAAALGVAERVRFLGGRDDVPALLAAADGLVLPSRDEATGTVILEAAAAGLPVLATANCGYAHYLERAGAGLVTPEPFDQRRFNQQLEQLLVSDERTAWARAGRALGRDERLYAMPRQAVDALERLAAGKRSSPGRAPPAMRPPFADRGPGSAPPTGPACPARHPPPG